MIHLRRRDALGVFALSPLLAAQGCRLRRASELCLGALAASTGERAPWGEDLRRGLELAVDQQNARGGIHGRRLRLASVDTESNDERGGALVTRLVDRESPVAIFGELSTRLCERAAGVAQRRGVVFVSPASTARDVSRVGDMVFRTSPTDAEQVGALARYARQGLQKRRVAVVYRRSSLLHVGMADAFSQAFRAGGGEIALRDSYTDDTELVRLVARVRASSADLIFAPSETADAGRIAVALRQGRVSAQVMGGDGWSSAEVRRFAPDAVNGALFTDLFAPSSPRPEVEPFVAVFQQRYRAVPGTFAALGYDAARWVIRAALRAQQVTPTSLRDALLVQRLDDAVCSPLSVGPRRELHRGVHVLRHEREGAVLAATEVS
ncbi:MAG: ABC transporter substrate-binding protein [Polyangiales bacterium]